MSGPGRLPRALRRAASSWRRRTRMSLARESRRGRARSPKCDSRIQTRIRNIHDRVADNHEKCREQRDRHDWRDVKGADRVSCILAYASEREDGLREDCAAANYRAEVEAPERYHRDQRASKDVPDENATPSESLRVCRAH